MSSQPHVVFENFSPHPELRVGIKWTSTGYNAEGGNLLEGPIEMVRVENRTKKTAGVRFTGVQNKQLTLVVPPRSIEERTPSIADRQDLRGVEVRWPLQP